MKERFFILIFFFLMTDPYTLFTLQVDFIQGQSYAEVAIRSIADPSRYLVLTPQGLRLEAPSGNNHIFRSDSYFSFREQLVKRGTSFYQLNSNSQKCFIAFGSDGAQLSLAEFCSPDTRHVFAMDYVPL